jgi:hypothetical protein
LSVAESCRRGFSKGTRQRGELADNSVFVGEGRGLEEAKLPVEKFK